MPIVLKVPQPEQAVPTPAEGSRLFRIHDGSYWIKEASGEVRPATKSDWALLVRLDWPLPEGVEWP